MFLLQQSPERNGINLGNVDERVILGPSALFLSRFKTLARLDALDCSLWE
jgi:hypothetical protein